MLRRTFPVLIVLLVVSADVSGQWKFKPKEKLQSIAVFVRPIEATPGGFVDTDSKRLDDSRADFLNALKKEKSVHILESEDGADVVLSMLSSKYEKFGATIETSPRLVGRGSKSDVEDKENPVVRVMLRAGEYEREFQNNPDVSRIVTWRVAAGDAADRIKAWINDNRAQLLAKRTQ